MQENYGREGGGRKDDPGAIEAVNKGIALDTQNDQLKTLMVQLTYQARGADAAVRVANSFTKANPESPTGTLLAAAVLGQSGKRADAIAMGEKYPAADATAPPSKGLAPLYQRNNDQKRAHAPF